MRRIIRAMSEIYRGDVKDQYDQANAKAGAVLFSPEQINTRLAEIQENLSWVDSLLNGVTPTSPNNALMAETMGTGDYPNAIQSFVNRLAIPGYQKKMFNFEPLVWGDTLTNYLTHNRYQHRDSIDDMELVLEKGRARPGSKDDAVARLYKVYRWEKQYDFSYEAIRNDDMGYFMDQADLMGQSARRSLEKFVSRMYTNATTIARLVALGALYSQNGRLTSARISEARMAYNQRTDSRAQPINARVSYVVGHSGLADTALQIQSSELVPELATNAANVVRSNWQWIEDPYIVGTAPNLPWYAFPDYRENNIRPFVLARLAGWPGPRIFRKRSDIEAVSSMLGAGASVDPMLGDFDSGNIVLKVADVYGTYVDGTEGSLFDFRGGYYSTGTAP